jgi:hypothetical protein
MIAMVGFVLLFVLQKSFGATVTYLGGFPCKAGITAGPGFLSFTPQHQLIVSQFTGDPFEKDSISLVENLPALLAEGNASAARCIGLSTAITWPNFVDYLALGGGSLFTGVLAPGGFLVPGKSLGAVSLLPVDFHAGTAGAPVALTAPKIGWFYHRAVPFDVDADGLLDIISARAVKPLTPLNPPAGELVWLRQPPASPFAPSSLPWQERVLRNGSWAPDVCFTPPISLRGDGDQQLFFASFFTGGGLAMLQCSGCAAGGGATWATAQLTLTVLDATLGPSFDVSVVDLNGDHRLDLLVTNHADNATAPHTQSQVAAYVAPPAGTPLTSPSAWSKHVLAEGFLIRELGPNQASPGEAEAVLLKGAQKPLVLVSGDGEQRLTLLEPVSQSDPDNWGYTRTEVFDCKGTTGKQAALQVQEETYLLLPCYDAGTIQAFKIEP